MRARQRSAVVLIILALVCFLAHWPLDNYICNPKTWQWREPSRTSTGEDFFSVVLRGGGGTPAMFAMLGGQRYLVANILWNYADVMFHKGKIYEMVNPFESCVTLNPSFLEAWSVYGWHLAWNLNADAKTYSEKYKWLRDGEKVYQRAIAANPDKPRPLFDLAWLNLQRRGNYVEAIAPLEKVFYSGKFQPLTVDERKKENKDYDPELSKKFDASIYGLRLAYVYKKIGIITEDQAYFQKAIDTYAKCKEINPDDKDAIRLYDELVQKRYDKAWIKKEQDMEAKIRENFQMDPVHFGGKSANEIFNGTTAGHTGLQERDSL